MAAPVGAGELAAFHVAPPCGEFCPVLLVLPSFAGVDEVPAGQEAERFVEQPEPIELAGGGCLRVEPCRGGEVGDGDTTDVVDGCFDGVADFEAVASVPVAAPEG